MLRRNTVILSLSMTAVGIILVAVSMFGLSAFAFVNPVLASSSPQNVGGNVLINSVCTISLTNTLIQFGGSAGVAPGTISTVNSVIDTNGGNIGSYIWAYAGNWVYASNTFGGTNTLWGATSSPLNPTNAVSSNTAIALPAPTLGNPTSNTIYFAVNVPVGTPAGTFQQSITITNTC
jgi:hypothetical protein